MAGALHTGTTVLVMNLEGRWGLMSSCFIDTHIHRDLCSKFQIFLHYVIAKDDVALGVYLQVKSNICVE